MYSFSDIIGYGTYSLKFTVSGENKALSWVADS